MTRPFDPELVRRCLDGDESAWVALTERYADVAYGVARRSGLRATEAGDVVQEVFLALLQALPRLHRSERLLAWILKTARREAWRQVRRTRAAHAREHESARPDRSRERLPAGALAALEEEQAVREAFRGLTERCRRLLDALFFDGQRRSYAEIGRELGLPVGSIGPTRKRCLAALRALLEGAGFGGFERFGKRGVSDEGGSASRRSGRTRA